MRLKRLEATSFKRFTHLIVEDIPETAKLIVLVGPNGSGKTSFLEAINFYYKYWSFGNLSNFDYIEKIGKNNIKKEMLQWGFSAPQEKVSIEFYNFEQPQLVGNSDCKGHFYFRSAYRNEPDFKANYYISNDINPFEKVRLESFMQNDMTVSQNYQRLIANSIRGLYDQRNDTKSVIELREELVGVLKAALSRITEDLDFEGVGTPGVDGDFYFSKGIIENFNYMNLSAGEKAAFDLLLDLVVQSEYYKDAIFCIDEPEIHMHTKLQGKLLRELYSLVPIESQLIISTHSIGMLKEAEEIERAFPGTVVFLDFSDRDYDEEQVIRPSRITKAVQEKFYELAFGDLSKLILPEIIVFCEGSPEGKSRKDFDKRIYSSIFENSKPNTLFLSAGACNDIERLENSYGIILNSVLKNSEVIKIVDRDDRSDEEIAELRAKGIKTLSKRNIESYLLDDEVIINLCNSMGKPNLIQICLEEKTRLLQEAKDNGKPSNDLKNIRGPYYNFLREKLDIVDGGNNCDTFLRDTMAKHITEETRIYKILEQDIFG